MKVLILCHDFPPLNSIGAERPYSWFLNFHNHGIETTVITKNWKKNGGSKESFVAATSQKYHKEKTDQGLIIEVPHNRILPERMILKYGINRRVLLRKGLTFLYKLFSFHSAAFDQHKYIHEAAKKYLEENEVDVVITSGEPHILTKYAYNLKSKHQFKWIADFRDGWYFDHVTSLKKDIFTRILRLNEYYCERRFLKRADYISTVDPLLLERLERFHKKPGICIYNGFWKFHDPIEVKHQPKLIISHTGTLTPGQRVEFFLESVQELLDEGKLTPNEIELRFIGIEYQTDQLERILSFSETTRKCIVTTARIPKEQATQNNLSSDLLLSLTDENFSAIYAKTYNYIACKKEIIVVPDDNSILGNLIREHKLGSVFNTKQELKTYLFLKVQEKKKGFITSSFSNEENLKFFLREHQAMLFAKRILEIA